ncbi:MAG: MoaD/ThiS family protein [Dehalococcoidia bacterium]|nr:MoaD/ThiS family protein [Dehalococcoidia bacterium]
MAIKVKIPTPLRSLTSNKDLVEITASNVKEVIETLEQDFPGMQERICEEDGTIRRFVNIYVNGEDVRFLDELSTQLKDNDEISIVPAVAGGAC